MERSRDLREDAAIVLKIDSDDVSPDLVMKPAVAEMFQLTQVLVVEDPPAKRAKTTKKRVSPACETTGAMGDVRMKQESSPGSSSDSSDSYSDGRWQIKKGTYRLKKAHLPDVRDSDVAMVPSTTS